MIELLWLDPENPVFPDTRFALEEPPGLLTAGGRLDTDTLRAAYYRGIFPWYSQAEPPLWWSPEPRAVLLPGDLHIGRSSKKLIGRHDFSFTTNQAFSSVIQRCSDSRKDETWILEEMIDAYTDLHREGLAQSLEVWQADTLVGGLYGVQVGSVFCGESMFHEQPNASKLAFICLGNTLFANGFNMLDCQLMNPFLKSLGVHAVSRKFFETALGKGRDKKTDWPKKWVLPNLENIGQETRPYSITG